MVIKIKQRMKLEMREQVYYFNKKSREDAILTFSDKVGGLSLYQKEKGYGLVNKGSTYPARSVDASRVYQTEKGIFIQETDKTIEWKNENNYNYGGIIFRIDVEEPGAYEVEVTIPEQTDETMVSVSGMNGYRLLDCIPWDAARTLVKTNNAIWKNRTWRYEYVTGRNFIDIEIEPYLGTKEAPSKVNATVGIEKIVIRPVEKEKINSEKPTIYTLGDSTVKSYIYEEAIMSGWGQVFDDLFDLNLVNVWNYSMGGRSLKSIYGEGRLNEVLIIGKPGDYLLLQSGHNDESLGEETGPQVRFGRGNTEGSYETWLTEVYLPAIKSRGFIPVFVTPMTRIDTQPVVNSQLRLAGFTHSQTPGMDFPGIMKRVGEKEAIPIVDLYTESIHYLTTIGMDAATAMFLSVEPGETPGKTNSGSYANGNPSGAIDGTHYKETLAKQFARIVVTGLYQLNLSIKNYLRQDVIKAIETKDWSTVYSEISQDVISGEAAYYREQIECLLKHKVMDKKYGNYFCPKESITVSEYIESLRKIWSIPKEAVFNYTDQAMTREVMAAIIYDAYLVAFGKNIDGSWVKPKYMTDYNGNCLSPDDPNYDPNLIGEEAQYYPLVAFNNIVDMGMIDIKYLHKFRDVYELGLLRSEVGIKRGNMKNGDKLEPKVVVTREKAAKTLYFLRILKKDIWGENDQ